MRARAHVAWSCCLPDSIFFVYTVTRTLKKVPSGEYRTCALQSYPKGGCWCGPGGMLIFPACPHQGKSTILVLQHTARVAQMESRATVPSQTSHASSPPRKGFAISSEPREGATRVTLVPRHTTSPSGRVCSVVLMGSSGSGVVKIGRERGWTGKRYPRTAAARYQLAPQLRHLWRPHL